MRQIVYFIFIYIIMQLLFPKLVLCYISPCEDSLYLYLKNEKITDDMSSGELQYLKIMHQKCEKYQREERKNVEESNIRKKVRKRVIAIAINTIILIVALSFLAKFSRES